MGSRRLTVRIEYASTAPRMTTPIRSLIALPFGLSTPASTDARVGDAAAGREPGAVGAVHQDPGGGVLGDHLAAVLGLDRDAHADRAAEVALHLLVDLEVVEPLRDAGAGDRA